MTYFTSPAAERTHYNNQAVNARIARGLLADDKINEAWLSPSSMRICLNCSLVITSPMLDYTFHAAF